MASGTHVGLCAKEAPLPYAWLPFWDRLSSTTSFVGERSRFSIDPYIWDSFYR